MTTAPPPPGPRADTCHAPATAAAQEPGPASRRVTARVPLAAVLPAEPAARQDRRADRARPGRTQRGKPARHPARRDPGAGQAHLHLHDPARRRPGRAALHARLAGTLRAPRHRRAGPRRGQLSPPEQRTGPRPGDALLPGLPRRRRIRHPGIVRRPLAENLAPSRRLRLHRPPAAAGAPLPRLRPAPSGDAGPARSSRSCPRRGPPHCTPPSAGRNSLPPARAGARRPATARPGSTRP